MNSQKPSPVGRKISPSHALFTNFLKRYGAVVFAAAFLSIQGCGAHDLLPEKVSASAPVPTSATPAVTAESNHLTAAEREKLEGLFDVAIHNTDTQMTEESDGTIYVKTGDIPAEWLRDSSAQIRPYLFLARKDRPSAEKIKKVILRQAAYLQIDPYANAFREDSTIWERKFELDSLAYPLLLAWTYWKVTGDDTIFTANVKKGFASVLRTILIEQDHDGRRPGHQGSKYVYINKKKVFTTGPVADTGMIWTGFRPSDDSCQYGFLIPSEMMLVQAMGALNEMAKAYGDPVTAGQAMSIRKAVHRGIQKYGIAKYDGSVPIYAYETDGFGHFNFIDDANLPSLLSAPYFGYPKLNDPVYQNTRARLLSSKNKYYYVGKFARGIGSRHTPQGMIWPLALIAQGLTSLPADMAERESVARMILASDLGDHHLHESFDANDPRRFTRPDFGWPNALFAEFYLVWFKGEAPLPLPSTDDLKESP